MGEEQAESVGKFTFSIDLNIEVFNQKEAHVEIPRELRLTQPLLTYLAQALTERGLELKHLKIKEEHRRDLKEMPDAAVEENQDNLRIRF